MEKRSQQDRGNPKRKTEVGKKRNERERLNRKYRMEENGTLYVSDMLKQKIKAGGIKIKRYDEKCQQFRQKQQFQKNNKLFYEIHSRWKEKRRERTT